MGALAVLSAAARHGERVSALALLGVAPKMPVHPDLLDAAKRDDHLAVDLVSSWGHGPSGHLGGARAPGLWLMMGGERLLERSAPGVLYNDLAACNAFEEGAELAGRVACPTLLVLAEMDKMTPAKAGRKLAGTIPDAQVVTVGASGHMMMTEQPDATLDALKGFFRASAA